MVAKWVARRRHKIVGTCPRSAARAATSPKKPVRGTSKSTARFSIVLTSPQSGTY